MKSTTATGQSLPGQTSPLRGTNEANVSTEQQATETDARLSRSYEQRRRPSGAQTPARERAQAPDRQHSTEATSLTHAPAGQRLPRAKRIRKRGEFLKLQQVGQRRAGMRFVVITAPRPGDISRIGITASKRVGGAVVRNRVKRLVREFFRRHQRGLAPPRDVLVIARPAAADANYAAVRDELSAALKIDAAE